MKQTHAWSLQRCLGALLLTLTLVACGGGGSAVDTEPALPTALAVVAPATRQALNSDISFSSNAVDPDGRFTHHWDFGDGSTSQLPAPRHAYLRSGRYTVQLTLRNAAGAVAQASHTLTVADLAIVQGRTCSGADSGGWCWQNPLPQGNPIQGSFWLDGQRGWAVGDLGTLLRTVDGGSTWTAQPSGTQGQLLNVVFVTDQVGWVAGSNGLLLRTTDGGSNWQALSIGVNTSASSLGAVDASTAWVTSGEGSYLSRDGGSTWQHTPRPPQASGDMQRTSASTLWVLAYQASGTGLLRTVDNGASWMPVSLPSAPDTLYRSLQSLRFLDDQRGIVSAYEYGYDNATQLWVSRTAAWLTVDGGSTWQVLSPPPSGGYDYLPQEYQLARDGSVFARVGYGSDGIAYSTDSGATWRTLSPPTTGSSYLSGYTPYSSTRVLQRLGDGRTWFTADAGANWTELQNFSTGASSANSVWFFNAREGLALTDDGSSLRTSDGGQTWEQRQTTADCCAGWSGLSFTADGATGWAISSVGQIYRSTDRGRTWLSPVPQTSAQLGTVLDYHFVDAHHGWALSESRWSLPGGLFSTSDGGASWQAVSAGSSLNGMRAMRFADRGAGVAVGAAGVAMVTSDGGVSWRARPTGSTYALRKLAFVDAQTVVAVGDSGSILRSTDRGQTWSRVSSATAANLTDLRFVSATVGHAVGDMGVLLITDDGGLSWRDASPLTRLPLRGVFFIDADTGWAVGSNGAILATISGGR